MATPPSPSGSACPKCGRPFAQEECCPQCGIIFAKFRARPVEARPASSRGPESPRRPWLTLGLALLAAGALAFWWVSLRQGPTPAPPAAPAPASADASPAAAAPTPLLGPTSEPTLPLLQPSPALTGTMTEQDRATVALLTQTVNAGRAVSAQEVRNAEALYAKYPGQPAVADLLGALLLRWCRDLRRQGNDALAADTARRATVVCPKSVSARLSLLDLELALGDWPAAEEVARQALALAPDNPIALEGLGRALMRLGRDQEASEVLSRAGTEQAQALLAKIKQGMLAESGMREQQLGAFTLRYDGDAHESIGREILRALERHFATMVLLFDHRPKAPISVILFSRESYYETVQAPRWSGGVFDNVDGRIRVPIGGLDPTLSPQLDSVLVHELTHAFVADITRGTAPRELHEGLAQLSEGKHIEDMLPERYLTALADGRLGGVHGLYLNALALGEYLIDLRGQSGVNDLLRAMGQTRNVDEASRTVYGQDWRDLREAAQQRLRQRHGS